MSKAYPAYLLFIASLLCGRLFASETVLQHDVELSLTVASGEIEIVDRLRTGPRQVFEFELAPWLELRELRVGGRPVQYRRDGTRYRVSLAGEADPELHFELRGAIPGPAAGALSRSGSDGVYLPGYAAWLPYVEGARVEYRLRLRVADGLHAVMTGTRVAEHTDDGEYRAEFRSAWPAQPPSLFAGPYRVQERRGPGPLLRSYFHPELEPLAAAYLEAGAAYIARYSELIGAYPYDEFRIVSAPLPVGLGFPGLTYVGREVLPLPFMRGRSLAHEVLHCWWGNGVAVDYAGGNWAEGLTTYLADYALAEDGGDEPARAMRLKWLRDYAALPSSRDRALTDFIGKQHDAAQVVGYNKAAFVFHMLRNEIGESAFREGLRRLWRQHRQESAHWDDLRAAFEHSAGTSLDWFFEQWIARRGAPVLDLGAHRVEPTANGYRLAITLRQRAPAYRLSLPLRLTTRGGEELRRVTVDATENRFEFDLAQAPLAIQIDPDSAIFRRLHADESPRIIRDLSLAADTLTVIAGGASDFDAAARELAGRLLDNPPRFADAASLPGPDRPLLLFVESERLESVQRRLELVDPPRALAARHSAGAWTARRKNGATLLIVTARDAGALRALVRPLPHYRGQSYVLFDGSRAVERGIWPVARGPLYREF